MQKKKTNKQEKCKQICHKNGKLDFEQKSFWGADVADIFPPSKFTPSELPYLVFIIKIKGPMR